jgi:glycosyltransferase involved in cell wall biosynthesis
MRRIHWTTQVGRGQDPERRHSKRVLYLEANEDGTVGGSHKILADLVTRLSPDFEPVVLYYQDNAWAERLAERGIEVHTWDAYRKRERARYESGGKLASLAALTRGIVERRCFLRRERIDLLHLANSPLTGIDDWLPAALSLGIPAVSYAMGDAGRAVPAARRLFLRRFARVFSLSRYVEQGFVAMGVRPERSVLAYPGLDFDAYRPESGTAGRVRALLGVEHDTVLAVMVGNLREWKGQHVVVDAVSRLDSRARSRLVVLLVGEAGPEHASYEARIRAAISEAELADTIRPTGRRSDVLDLFEAADIAIHASIVPEPFGLVVLEAMSRGCAVVASEVGGPAEILTEASGLTFEPSRPEELTRHLKYLIENPDVRTRIGQAARIRARKFDVHEHVSLVERAYREVLS